MAQLGRALRSGRRGRKFESCHPDDQKQWKRSFPLFFCCGNGVLRVFWQMLLATCDQRGRCLCGVIISFLRERGNEFLGAYPPNRTAKTASHVQAPVGFLRVRSFLFRGKARKCQHLLALAYPPNRTAKTALHVQAPVGCLCGSACL